MSRHIQFISVMLSVVSINFSSPVHGSNISINPELSVEEVWDSNILNSAYLTEESDYFTRITPGINFATKYLDTSLHFRLAAEMDIYRNHSELNKIGASKIFDIGVDKPFQVTPTIRIQPILKFVSTTDAARRNQILQVPDPGGTPPPESVITQGNASRDYIAGIRFEYALSPRSNAGIGGTYMERHYVENIPGLFDAKTISGSGSLSYGITPRVSTGLMVGISSSLSDNNVQSNKSYSGEITGGYKITETFSGDARIGVVALEATNLSTDKKELNWSPSGYLAITYRDRNFSTRLESSRNIAIAGSYGQPTERTSLLLSVLDRIGEKWYGDGSLSYQTNKSLDDPGLINIETWHGTLGFRYVPLPWLSFSLSGTRHYQGSYGTQGISSRKNTLSIGVTIARDILDLLKNIPIVAPYSAATQF